MKKLMVKKTVNKLVVIRNIAMGVILFWLAIVPPKTNYQKIVIHTLLTCTAYGFSGKACIGGVAIIISRLY